MLLIVLFSRFGWWFTAVVCVRGLRSICSCATGVVGCLSASSGWFVLVSCRCFWVCLLGRFVFVFGLARAVFCYFIAAWVAVYLMLCCYYVCWIC